MKDKTKENDRRRNTSLQNISPQENTSNSGSTSMTDMSTIFNEV